jgi:hypothetical protein
MVCNCVRCHAFSTKPKGLAKNDSFYQKIDLQGQSQRQRGMGYLVRPERMILRI